MPSPPTSNLGSLYITLADFKSKSYLFGVGTILTDFLALVPAPDQDQVLTDIIAAASREVDNYCCRTFNPGEVIAEVQIWNPHSRKVCVNAPPVTQLISFLLRRSADFVINYDPAVDIYIDNEQGLLELQRAAFEGTISATQFIPGIIETRAEFTYKSFAAIPAEVVTATGRIAAGMVTNNVFNARVTPGITMEKAGPLEVRSTGKFQDTIISKSVMDSLSSVKRISVA